MADWVEITDRKSAQAWLEQQDHQTQIWFTTRCALRALPALGNWSDATRSGLAFGVSRMTFVWAAMATCPAAEMMGLKTAAASAARHGQPNDAAEVVLTVDRGDPDAANAAASAHFAGEVVTGRNHSIEELSDAVDNAAHAVHQDIVFWDAISVDANKPMTWSKLWPKDPQPESLQATWRELKAQWDADAADWSFWIEWYERILDGNPMDWDLIFEIATKVNEADWDAGPAVVAAKIEIIRSKFDLEREIEKLKRQLSENGQSSVADRKHNNPPPLDDETTAPRATLADIWNELDSLENELAVDNPDPSKIKAIAERLWAAAVSIAKYCGNKIETALDKAAEELGSAGAKWVVRTGAAYWVASQEGTQSVAKMAWQFAEKLMSGG